MKYYFLTLFALLCTVSCSMHPKTVDNIGGTIIECRFSDMEQNGESPSQILEILNSRLKYQKRATTPTVAYNDTTGIFRIEIPGVTDVDAEQLVSQGQLSICEVYKIPDVEDAVRRTLSDTLLQQYIDPSFHPASFSGNAFLGGVRDKDIHLIDSLLASKRSIFGFPHNIKFCWSWDVEDDMVSGYLLYMVKMTDHNIDLIATHKSSGIEKNSYNSHESVNLKLNDLGATKFSQMTERNIGRSLAIVADGRVLSAPTVMNKIEGGRLIISGAFSKSYLEGLLGLLNSSVIKSDAEIISVIVKGDREKKLKRS